jgi:outer membrane protein OmpA-like peptidoglycan-associated protein
MQQARRVSIVLSLIAAYVIGTSVALAAAGEAGSWELGPYAGYGSLDDYAGADPDDDLLYGGRVGYFFTPAWSLEASYQQLSTETELGNVDVDLDSTRLNLLYNFRQGQKLRPFLTGGLGIEGSEAQGGFDESDTGYNAGGGLRWFLGDSFGLRLDGRYVYTKVGGPVDDGQSNLEATAGLLFAFGGGPPKDTDGDGVRDSKDKCPDTPRGATVDEKGCPRDADGDGVYDGLDSCPDTPAGCPVDERGCPKDSDGDAIFDCHDKCAGTPKGCQVDASGCPKDEDGDGVCDGADRCPGTPKGCQVDASGCPKDEDGDGVCDGADRCPGTPKGCQVDASGCPKDVDGDGVCDGVDRCPGTPKGRKVDAKGCELAFTERGTLRLEGVHFALDSDRLTPESTTILDGVAASLREWPELRVEVGGHTDSSGSEGHNLDLSQRRANAVRDHLVSKGVAASRLTAKGYGEALPEADNKTEEGRTTNRRVELKKLE